MQIIKKELVFLVIGIFILVLPRNAQDVKLSDNEMLGKSLFFDENLSTPPGQSCATCHGQAVGWTGPDSVKNEKGGIYPGAQHPRFGNRKPPSAAYAGKSPKLHKEDDGTFIGGMFWDGRASGWEIEDPLTEQAMGPFLNPLEQNMPDKKSMALKVKKSDYSDLFRKVWGKDSLSLQDADKVFICIARSIAAFERSKEVNPFNSTFDKFWYQCQARGLKVESIDENNIKTFKGLGLETKELEGLMLFNTRGKCSECHVLSSENNEPPLFTDFTYDNLGVPKNNNNPFYGVEKQWNPKGNAWIDKGLGGFLEETYEYKKFAKDNYGKHKVPTLRNVDRRPSEDFVKVFMHNGCFKTLKEVVNFYNTRDKKDARWPDPEVKENVNREELGDLGLSSEEEDAIILFMKTLSDR